MLDVNLDSGREIERQVLQNTIPKMLESVEK